MSIAISLLCYSPTFTSDSEQLHQSTISPVIYHGHGHFGQLSSTIPSKINQSVMLVLVLVLKYSLRTKMKSLSLSWSLEKSPCKRPCSSVFQAKFHINAILDSPAKLRFPASKTFCTPASSAPVKRVFSQTGLIMWPHRAKMNDTLLETLV